MVAGMTDETAEPATPVATSGDTAHVQPGAGAVGRTVADWHRFVRGDLPGGLDVLLHDDVVFYSPIVYTPQAGKAITKRYLEAAAQTLVGDAPKGDDAAGDGRPGGFRYTKEVLAGHVAVLEFETTIEGKYVNGVDIIRCDDDGRIVEFRVMIRPLQAVDLVHRQMASMLDRTRT